MEEDAEGKEIMRDLTRDELAEYFRFARADKAAGDFHQDQAELIGATVTDSGLLNVIAAKLEVVRAAGFGPEDAFLSIWVSAFQMGRECESRLLTMALKARK